MKKISGVFIIILLHLHILLSPSGPGTTPFAFLKILPSARISAMGETSTSNSEGAESIFSNPARFLYPTSNKQLFLSYIMHLENIYLSTLSTTLPIGKKNHLGFGIIYLGMDKMKSYDDDGERIENAYHTASNLSLMLSYNRMVFRNISLGLTLKYIKETLADYTFNTFNFDLGLNYTFEFERIIYQKRKRTIKKEKIDFGLTINNIGPNVKFKTLSSPQPMVLKFGASYKYKKLLISTDLRIPVDNIPSIHLGCEQELSFLRLRAGFKTSTLPGLNILSGFSVGCGIYTKIVNLDYAFLPYGELGLTHRISTLIRF